MSTKRKECKTCLRPINSCYCHTISKISNNKPIMIIRHIKEAKHPFNTAHMANLSLTNAQIVESNDPCLNEKLLEFITDFNPLLIFKSIHSKEIMNQDILDHNGYIFLDGTWDKAKSILFSNKLLQNLPQRHFVTAEKSIYAPIRKACSSEFLSTIEAIKEVIEMDEQKEIESLLDPLKHIIKEQKKWVP